MQKYKIERQMKGVLEDIFMIEIDFYFKAKVLFIYFNSEFLKTIF
jgi:hypothetical protein